MMESRKIYIFRRTVVKYFLFCLIYTVISLQIMAQVATDSESVDLETAKSVALNYCLKTEKKYSGATANDISLTLVETKESDKSILYYVFNINNSDGYIIISASFNSPPVLCYVPKGSFDLNPENHSPAFIEWLDTFASQIEYTMKNKLADSRMQSSWNDYLSKGQLDNEQMKLNLTSTWGQFLYYNSFCPDYTMGDTPHDGIGTDGHCPTGCVATAMGQIIYYFEWPANGTGSLSYEDPANTRPPSTCEDSSYGWLSFNNHTGTYDYDAMEDDLGATNDEVARLLYNCGVSVTMDYKYCASFANTYWVPDAMIDYFSYSNEASYENRSAYSEEGWEDLLINQIKLERPVQYRGQSGSNVGHSWVLMGYKLIEEQNTQFWMNIGMDGNDDGWYTLTNLLWSMNDGNGAVINIHPPVQPDLEITSASLSKTAIFSGEAVTLNMTVNNKGSRDAVASTAECYLSSNAILDKNDILLGFVSTPALAIGLDEDLVGSIAPDVEATGDYYIIIQADANHEVHEAIENDNLYVLGITIQGTVPYLRYRTRQSGEWNELTTWEYETSQDVWENAIYIPSRGSNDITIRTGHTITLSNSLIIDEVTIETGAQLIIPSGDELTIYDNGSYETDFSVSGILNNQGTVTVEGGLAFNSGSTYIHATDGGSIPTADWNTTSTCLVTGIASTAPAGFGQSFGNFTWNCTSQSTDVLINKDVEVKGDFTLSSTGSNSIFLASTVSRSLTILGNYLQTDGNFKFNSTDYGPAAFMFVAGNMTTTSDEGSIVVDVTAPNGTITFNGGSPQTLYFANSACALWTNFVVNSGSTLLLGSNLILAGSSGYPANFVVNGTLNAGTKIISSYPQSSYAVTGFYLYSGATIITANENYSGSYGALSSSGAYGSVQTATRSFSTGANYVYNGTANQRTGTGLPTGLTGKLTINNQGYTVYLNNNRTIAAGGIIEIVNGTFYASNPLTMTSGSSINRSGGSMTGTPTGTWDVSYSGNSMTSSSEVSGTGLRNVNVSLNDGQTLALGQNIAPNGDINIVTGTFNLGIYTCNRAASGGTFAVSNTATLKVGGTNSMPANYGTYSFNTSGTVEYSGAAQTVTPLTYSNLILSGSDVKTIAAGREVTVSNAFTTNNLLTIESSGLNSTGSLIVNGSSTGNVTFRRQLHMEGTDYAGDYHYVASPVASNTNANIGKLTSVWRWDEDRSTGNCWVDLSQAFTAYASGRGYNLDQTSSSDGKIEFNGTVVTTGFSVTATSPYLNPFDGSSYDGRQFAPLRDGSTHWGGGGWNMLGNPFTSAMETSAFIDANTSSFDPNYLAVFIYDGSVGEHGTFYSDMPYIQAGQGFFVMAMNNNVPFSFTPGSAGMQRHSTSAIMLKSSSSGESWPGLKLKVRYGENESSTSVSYNENMTAGLDPGYDIGLLSTSPDVEIYTTLVLDNGVNFARQALPLSNYEENIVPVGIISEKGGHITFSADVIPIDNHKFYLEDRETGIFTDLNKDNYTALLSPKTNGTGRFFIQTSSRRMMRSATGDENVLLLRIWASKKEIHIEGEVSENAVCTVFDIQGRKCKEIKLTDAANNIITLPLSIKGVYVVKVTDGVRVSTQRVMIL